MKKTMMKLFVITVVTFGFVSQSHAGLLLEPYLGYISGKTDQGATSTDFTGTIYGARAGWSFLGFAVGADYTAGSAKDDSSPKTDITMGDVGVFVAYKFPILVRAYLTYVPTSVLETKSGGVKTTIQDGTSTKIGIGYTGFPVVSINLEYQTSEYGEAKQGGVVGDFSPKFKATSTALTISAPFDLL